MRRGGEGRVFSFRGLMLLCVQWLFEVSADSFTITQGIIYSDSAASNYAAGTMESMLDDIPAGRLGHVEEVNLHNHPLTN